MHHYSALFAHQRKLSGEARLPLSRRDQIRKLSEKRTDVEDFDLMLLYRNKGLSGIKKQSSDRSLEVTSYRRAGERLDRNYVWGDCSFIHWQLTLFQFEKFAKKNFSLFISPFYLGDNQQAYSTSKKCTIKCVHDERLNTKNPKDSFAP